jgi:ABC-type dipeptide/oligopeptide/nickel transport system ATPase subunit
MEKRIEIDVEFLDMVCDPKLYNYGNLRDYIHDFKYRFCGGNIYGIVGEFGSGGWALSYILSGRKKLVDDTLIKINGDITDSKGLLSISCYIGDKQVKEPNCRYLKCIHKKWTILEQIKLGIKKSGCKYSAEDIVRIFQLSDIDHPNGRVHRTMEYISNERWRATMAIGFASGKRIFCCPLLYSSYLHYIVGKEMINILDFLRHNGAIIIIPVTKVEYIKHVADEVVYLRNSEEVNLIENIQGK